MAYNCKRLGLLGLLTLALGGCFGPNYAAPDPTQRYDDLTTWTEYAKQAYQATNFANEVQLQNPDTAMPNDPAYVYMKLRERYGFQPAAFDISVRARRLFVIIEEVRVEGGSGPQMGGDPNHLWLSFLYDGSGQLIATGRQLDGGQFAFDPQPLPLPADGT